MGLSDGSELESGCPSEKDGTLHREAHRWCHFVELSISECKYLLQLSDAQLYPDFFGRRLSVESISSSRFIGVVKIRCIPVEFTFVWISCCHATPARPTLNGSYG
jgi:hypothetical protein